MTRDEIQKAFNELNKKYYNTLAELNRVYNLLAEKPQKRVVKVESSETVKRLQIELENLKNQLAQKPKQIEKQVPVEVEKPHTKDLRHAAKLTAQSDLNVEDLSEDEIYEILLRGSEAEVKRRIGFWAMPLPQKDEDPQPQNKAYITKK